MHPSTEGVCTELLTLIKDRLCRLSCRRGGAQWVPTALIQSLKHYQGPARARQSYRESLFHLPTALTTVRTSRIFICPVESATIPTPRLPFIGKKGSLCEKDKGSLDEEESQSLV